MNRKLVFSDSFELSVADAFDWYLERSEIAALHLLECVEDSLRIIEKRPTSFQIQKRNFRQVVLKPFPYVLVYRVRKEEIFIHKIFHTSRNPKKKLK